MDPALTAFDFAEAGAIVADMIVSYLAAGAPPLDPEEPDDPRNLQDCRSTPVETCVHLHPSIDTSPGSLQSGEYRSSVQPGQQSPVSGLEPGPDSAHSLKRSYILSARASTGASSIKRPEANFGFHCLLGLSTKTTRS